MSFLTKIAKSLDHSALKPTMTEDELEVECFEAIEMGVASVCVLPYFINRCSSLLLNTSVIPSTVVSFPHGSMALDAKMAEIDESIKYGAKEIDAVINISKVLSEDYNYIKNEITWLTMKCHAKNVKIKIIFETCYLSEKQIIKLCKICSDVDVDWIKTSTGFGTAGADEATVKLMLNNVGKNVQVKASGGIKDLATVKRFLDLGVTRIGTSNSMAILEEAKQENNKSSTEPY